MILGQAAIDTNIYLYARALMTSISESKISMQNTQLAALPSLEAVRFQKLPALQ